MSAQGLGTHTHMHKHLTHSTGQSATLGEDYTKYAVVVIGPASPTHYSHWEMQIYTHTRRGRV